MTEYAPTTDEVRNGYSGYWHAISVVGKNAREEFDACLAEVIREAKADAWDEGKVAYDFFPNFSVNPYRKEQQ